MITSAIATTLMILFYGLDLGCGFWLSKKVCSIADYFITKLAMKYEKSMPLQVIAGI
jgi:hypothetical protein